MGLFQPEQFQFQLLCCRTIPNSSHTTQTKDLESGLKTAHKFDPRLSFLFLHLKTLSLEDKLSVKSLKNSVCKPHQSQRINLRNELFRQQQLFLSILKTKKNHTSAKLFTSLMTSEPALFNTNLIFFKKTY